MAQNTPILLIVGLGNPGDSYRTTRHNVGFQFLDRLAASCGARFAADAKFFGETARISAKAGDVRLLKPTTFMNLSGSAVQASSLSSPSASTKVRARLQKCRSRSILTRQMRLKR